MAALSSLTISGSTTGDLVSGDIIGPTTLTNADAPVAKTTQSFAAATFAAVTFPALIGSSVIKGVIIQPPATNAGAITLKGVTGDTGIPLHLTEPTILRFPSISASSFGLLCANLTVCEFKWL